ncbi:MAG: cellulase family glycosylhydrolase [Firmicutes bacterium]|nr:cellulase family glycosylhydrolase [Bacillota bacterium]
MDKVKGVNFGGWFVLEYWMKPALFDGIDSKDETGFSTKNSNAKQDLKKHWETFITREDFFYIKSLGMNSIRLPIPWWLEGVSPYFSALPYIHQAMQWASDAELNILLDLHTAPGCQNGFDNGGIQDVMTWHLDQKNIKLTVDKLEFIVKEFKNYPSFWGIEVLNEPHATIDINIVQSFYKSAYQRIRKHTDKVIVFHDAFRPDHESWKNFFNSNRMKNIVFDLHLYHCFDHRLVTGDFDLHIKTIIDKRIPLIRELQKFIRVVVGEWSLGINYEKLQKNDSFNEALYNKILADLQLYAYTQGYGYYFWSYKIERESHENWDFRRLVQKGILPNQYND